MSNTSQRNRQTEIGVSQAPAKAQPVPRKYAVNAEAIDAPDLSTYDEILSGQSGPIRYSIINDFMFKYSFQENLYALKGLLSALLNIPDTDILSIYILNPISPGDSPDDKNCILDIKLILNQNRIINIELQVKYQYYYPERSLLYLCRCYDQLSSGEKYDQILPCVQISILDEQIFREEDSRYTDEFYSEYYITNRKTGKVFSDKFSLRVISLRHIENADNKEDLNGIYQWAKLFKSTTWEELKMLAEKNEYMKAMISGLKVLSEDEKVQLACEARERDARDRASIVASAKAEATAKATAETAAKYQPIIAEKDKVISEKDKILSEKDAQIEKLKKLLQKSNL